MPTNACSYRLLTAVVVGLAVCVGGGPSARGQIASPDAAESLTIEAEPVVTAAAKDVVGLYHRTHRIGFGVVVPDGYVDGGRSMQLDAAGRVTSSREVLVVDREQDAQLREALVFAGSAEIRGLSVDERIRRLADHVKGIFAPRGDRQSPFAGDDELADKCSGRGVLLGEVPDLCNGGVCRHQALLFKILANEAGLNAALVRGGYLKDGRDRPGAHAWCEVEGASGELVVIDTMRRNGAYITMSDPRARRYHDVTDRPLYGPDGPRQNLAIVAVTDPPFVDQATIRIVPPAQPDVTVHYTLDGTEPGSGSPRAEGPISVLATSTVRAAALAADGTVVDRVGRLVVVILSRGAATGPGLPQPSAN